jgi:PAS domain S-box-containing protein
MNAETSFTEFPKLLDTLAEVVCVIDKHNRFVYINAACQEVWGYMPGELIGKNCFDLIVEKDMNLSYEALERFLEGQVGFEFDNEYYHKDGSIVTMAWVGHFDASEELLYARGKNVTQKRKREKEIEMLSLIAKRSVNSIVVMDRGLRITWVNEAFIKTTGYTYDEAVGKLPSDLLAGAGTDVELIEQTSKRLEKGETPVMEVLGYTKTKKPFWANVQFQSLFDKEGKLDKIISIITDITAQKKLQAQLEEEVLQQQKRITAAAIKAQENERAQLGRELHDNVNQVLTTVKLFNEIIADSVTEHKELVHKSSAYLQNCIDEIRRITKRLSIPSLTEVGLIELTRELVDSINLTNQFEITYSLKGLHSLSISHDLQLAIYRIMQEQLNNIIKHADASMVTIALASEDNQLTLSITDDGRGFDSSVKRKGIGITNIKSRAESLDGTFHLETAPGKGCSVKIIFPLTAEPMPA